MRAVPHLLFPQPKGVARAKELRRLVHRLLWIPAPIHRLYDLRPEPHQPSSGQCKREQTARDIACWERRRKGSAERSGRERSEISFLVEPLRDLANEIGWWNLPAGDQIAV